MNGYLFQYIFKAYSSAVAERNSVAAFIFCACVCHFITNAEASTGTNSNVNTNSFYTNSVEYKPFGCFGGHDRPYNQKAKEVSLLRDVVG